MVGRLAAVFAIFGTSYADASTLDPLAVAMESADECAGADGTGCALNQLQVRATKAEAVEAEGVFVEARLHPMFCDYGGPVAASPACTASNSCSCQYYCTHTVRPQDWGWDPNCCGCSGHQLHVPGLAPPHNSGGGSCAAYGCGGFTKEHSCQCNAQCESHGNCCHDYKPKCTSLGASPDADVDAKEAVAVTFEPAAHPRYCNLGGVIASSPYCSGQNTCSCQYYCTAGVRPQDWGWDPNCCGCGSHASAPAVAGTCAIYGCGAAYTQIHSCQCNAECEAHNNCCSDYKAKCAGR